MRLLLLAIIIGQTWHSSRMHAFTLMSRSFSKREAIPLRHTCQNKNIPPYLTWGGIPENTQSFALIYQDITTQKNHWLVANIPATERGIHNDYEYTQGINSFQRIGYSGPCVMDSTRHEYKFELYALDSTLPLVTGFSYADLQQAMQGHIIATTKLFSHYQKR